MSCWNTHIAIAAQLSWMIESLQKVIIIVVENVAFLEIFAYFSEPYSTCQWLKQHIQTNQQV